MSASLHIEHPALRRGRTVVLEAGACAVPAGAVVGVIGLNGAGKSTLMMGLAGVLRGTRVIITRRDADASARAITSIGYAPQHPALPAWATARSVAAAFGRSMDALDEVVKGLRIGELPARRVSQWSGGQRQAFAVALALDHAAELIVLDEPFAALDLRRRRGLIDAIRRMAAHPSAPTILLSSQVGADLLELCDAFVVLGEGGYRFCGTREQLFALGGLTSQPDSEAFDRLVLDLIDGVITFEHAHAEHAAEATS